MIIHINGALRDYGSQIHRKIALARKKRTYDLISAFSILANAVTGKRVFVSDEEEFDWKGSINIIETHINSDKLSHKRGLREFRRRFHEIFKEEGIEFRKKMFRATIYEILVGEQDRNMEKGFSQDTEDYEKFWNNYHGKRTFESEMKKPKMRKRIAIEKAISIFNSKKSKEAGFRLMSKNWQDIIAHVDPTYQQKKPFGRSIQVNKKEIHLLYGTIEQIKKLLRQPKTRALLEEKVSNYGWQNGWKQFALECNKGENAIKNGFLIPSDIRLIRDLLRIKTIKKSIISPLLGIQ